MAGQESQWTHPVAPELRQLRRSDGLPTEVVLRQRVRFGANQIIPDSGSALGRLLLAALRDPMLWFLLGTSLLFAWLGDRTEALVLLFAILPLFGLDAFLHGRVAMRTASLDKRLAEVAEVIRDGLRQQLPARELVPGDRLLLSAGTHVPADVLLLEGESVQIDESALTGESMPVRKQPVAIDFAGTLVAHRHWIGAGTRVLTGSLVTQVVDTGAHTTYGSLARAAAQAQAGATPLQQSLRRLVAALLIAAIALCVLLAGVRLWQGFGLIDALLAAVVLAVAAIPEEFPLVFASFLGVGVYRMARRHALVRQAVAVESLGRISCICTDKTGTLTEGRVVLAHWLADPTADEAALLRAAAIASNPDSGDPVDLAVLSRVPAPPVETRFPFTEARRCEVGIVASGGGWRAAVKGAPETVFALCGLPAQSGDWQQHLEALASSGHKVLAVAERAVDSPALEPAGGYRMLGLLAFEDPLRPGVVDAIRAARAAGLQVIMVTGDHPDTARAIAAELGLGAGQPRVQAGGASVPDVLPDVVARCLPVEKLALVKALQARGERVAVTGDGINDVPALRGADVGIAMGERGTQAARDAAAVVLLDDAFATVVAAIAEGRQLFCNLQAAVAFLLLAHMPLVLSAALLPLSGYPLPYPPVLIVWLELLIHPLAFLAFQQAADGMRPPLERDARFFDARQWTLLVVIGALSTLAVSLAFVMALGDANDITLARGTGLGLLAGCILGSAAGLSRLRGRSAVAVVLLTTLGVAISLLWTTSAGWLGIEALRGGSAVAAGASLLLSAAASAVLARTLIAPAPRPAVGAVALQGLSAR